MKKTWVLSALVLAAMLPFGETTGFATVRGSIFLTPFGAPPTCRAEGTLYTNLTGGPINFDLSFSAGNCTATLSWTDADGQAQTFTLNPSTGNRQPFATSLPPGGAISFSTSGTTSSPVFLTWALGTSGGIIGGGGGTCGTSGGTIYPNLTANPIHFDFAAGSTGACGVILSWTDADGQAQTMTLRNRTQGASTSLPSGGVISWTLEPGAGSAFFGFDVERTALAAKHQKF